MFSFTSDKHLFACDKTLTSHCYPLFPYSILNIFPSRTIRDYSNLPSFSHKYRILRIRTYYHLIICKLCDVICREYIKTLLTHRSDIAKIYNKVTAELRKHFVKTFWKFLKRFFLGTTCIVIFSKI